MRHLRIFVNSVQKELASERVSLHNYIRTDRVLKRFFDLFLFEELPKSNMSRLCIESGLEAPRVRLSRRLSGHRLTSYGRKTFGKWRHAGEMSGTAGVGP